MSDIRRAALQNARRRHGNITRAVEATRREEVGATLVLALAFLLLGAIIIGSLMSALTDDLHSSVNFLSARSEQYAARSATDLAINSIRYARCSPSAPSCNTNTMLPQSLNASPPTWCWGSGPTSEVTVDGVSVDVWCSTAWNPTSTNSRVVTFSTCLDGIGAAQCAVLPYLQAVVTFDDYPTGVSAPSLAPCYLYCGTGMTTDSWLWSPVLPTVTGVSPSSGSILGGTQVTISGSGFTTGTTVNFVEESGGSPASDNTIMQATGVVINSSTSITADAPTVTEGTTYFVTVTTPTGTSAYNTNAIFTYSVVAPIVTNISPAIGTIAGGNAVTITGTGFYQSATQPITVSFIQESGGTVPGNALTYTVSSPNVVVNGGTSITVVSPPVAGGSSCQTEFCYFVTVTTPAGTSATGNGNIADIFEYTEIPPLCASVSPVSGSAGTPVTISGAGFLTGSGTSAHFVPEISGTPTGSGAGTTATVTSITPDQITVTAPTAPTGTSTSFVTVTTVNGTCQDIPYFTYGPS
jgi:hypothetical protein